MLIRLLRTQLQPYRRPVALVVLLQLIQTLATLYLPTLNADIIDNGVIKGDTSYIIHTGGIMMAVAVVQIACLVVAVYLGARTAMAVGRDLRQAVFSRRVKRVKLDRAFKGRDCLVNQLHLGGEIAQKILRISVARIKVCGLLEILPGGGFPVP